MPLDTLTPKIRNFAISTLQIPTILLSAIAITKTTLVIMNYIC